MLLFVCTACVYYEIHVHNIIMVAEKDTAAVTLQVAAAQLHLPIYLKNYSLRLAYDWLTVTLQSETIFNFSYIITPVATCIIFSGVRATYESVSIY